MMRMYPCSHLVSRACPIPFFSADHLSILKAIGTAERNGAGLRDSYPLWLVFVATAAFFMPSSSIHTQCLSHCTHTHTHTHSNCPSLIPTDTGCGYRQPKARLGRKHVRPWKWMPFTNPARQVHVRAPSPNVIPSPLLDSEEVVSCPDPLARAKRVWCSKQNLSHGAGPILDLRSPIRLQKT